MEPAFLECLDVLRQISDPSIVGGGVACVHQGIDAVPNYVPKIDVVATNRQGDNPGVLK